MKKLIIFLIATILLVIPAKKASAAEQNNISAGTKESPAYEGTWLHDARSDTWTYAYTHPFKNAWAYVVNPWNDNKPAWFFFDENGTMLTGWQMIYWNGSIKYFYFHEASDGRRGECQLGGITPDGYTVNKDGAWTVNGVVQEYYPVSLSPSSSNRSAAAAANAVPVANDALAKADATLAKAGQSMLIMPSPLYSPLGTTLDALQIGYISTGMWPNITYGSPRDHFVPIYDSAASIIVKSVDSQLQEIDESLKNSVIVPEIIFVPLSVNGTPTDSIPLSRR